MFFFPGVYSVPFIEVSVVNDTIERGSFFDIGAERFSPNQTNSGHDGILFDGIICGFSPFQEKYIQLTLWSWSGTAMYPLPTLPLTYQGRIKVPAATVMRIENVTFADEGSVFFCALQMHTKTPQIKSIVIHKTVKLKTVYGKF